MSLRWQRLMEQMLPAHDLIDLVAQSDAYYPKRRQFAPESSQSAYVSMLDQEFAIGDYIEFGGESLGLSTSSRQHMITLIEALNAEKKYKPETLYLAASLCDRYLVNLAIKKVKAPSLIILSVVCTLMAAKLE